MRVFGDHDTAAQVITMARNTHQIDDYISTHSEMLFSHGICPTCEQKLYPDFVE